MPDTKPPVIFVNQLEVCGFLNGVANIAFSTNHFLPEKGGAAGDKVVPMPEVTLNVRMDLWCLQQLHDAIGNILESQTKAVSGQAN